jgi:Holliday junction resolvasome RuvABC endonuclease subunit
MLSEYGIVTGGTWILASPKEITAQKKAGLDRCCDCRFARLQSALTALGTFDVCYFEDVQFSVSTQQTQLWASFRCVVTLLYPEVTLVAVPVGTLKKFATGSGNAKKEQMAAALVGGIMVANEKGDGFRAMDDNEVDARHLLNLARRDYNL